MINPHSMHHRDEEADENESIGNGLGIRRGDHIDTVYHLIRNDNGDMHASRLISGARVLFFLSTGTEIGSCSSFCFLRQIDRVFRECHLRPDSHART
jgi:hypothetical protein